ncbi:hypothetical protein [Paenibacillus sp. BK720]|uniref:hypothetical protein n=1 Tax=Paenibacillus sp. BK720 TaxID=2587092 RepID=UPI00141F2615|nr:hypothetical protein [Paenibacillus sp. BK720]NIK69015.1 glutathionyl-hydroquinone reductase [Paenibacillus sp. BK720]
MYFKIISVFLVLLIVLSVCSGSGEDNKSSLDDVIQSMENQGLKILKFNPERGRTTFNKLNDIEAETYAIDTYGMGDVTDEADNKVNIDIMLLANVYIYVFNTEKERIEGFKDFHKISDQADFVFHPIVYESNNILVIHFQYPEEKSEYDNTIKQAIEEL